MKKWNEPKLWNLGIEMTESNPEIKCTNNNGNSEKCARNPNNVGTFNGPMFECGYYGKQGHLCNSPNIGISPS
ncbi:MAG: hypothetical protein RR636_03825 [Clostridium sp.]|uniref:hypothetical protein n=1 Tax=Clostridium sp. TaxID=1506 RepID=UPI00303FD8AE